MKLTNRGKAVIAFVVIFTVAWLGYTVTTSALSPDCEHLYNEYSATDNVPMQQALLNKGVMNGCFHAN